MTFQAFLQRSGVHSTVLGTTDIVRDRFSVVGCVPRNLRRSYGTQEPGHHVALIPGIRSKAKAYVQASKAGKGRQLSHALGVPAVTGGMGGREVAGGEGSWHGDPRGIHEYRWGLGKAEQLAILGFSAGQGG